MNCIFDYRRNFIGSFLVKATQDPPPPPLKTVQKIGHPGTAIFVQFKGGGASKLYKTPSKGGPWLVKVMVHTVAVGQLVAV